MAARPDPQPMSTFDPTRPVMVHEQVHDVEVEWVPVTRRSDSEKPWDWRARSRGDRMVKAVGALANLFFPSTCA